MTDDLDIVIIGATGNLAKLKLLPALYDLESRGFLPKHGRLIGTARSEYSQEAFREMSREAAMAGAQSDWDDETWGGLASRMHYIRLPNGDLSPLRHELHEAERLIFLAIPPSYFGSTARGLAEQGLVEGTRLLIEKPFGRDLASARELDKGLREVLDESQIFRIDHYLGKETVQNILVFRFGNAVFERIWNRDAIDHIEITVAESAGIDGRGYFYEEVGALRDVVQNHLLQVLSILTMEPPASFNPEAIRDEKVKLLRAVQPLDPSNVVRDLHRDKGRHRELALGWRADLFAHRQAPSLPRDRDRNRVQESAAQLLRGDAPGPRLAEHPYVVCPARRRNHVLLLGQGAGAGDQREASGDELQLRLGFQCGARRGL
jgi:glucose-6-phosphate 1-dehydrogenase